MVVGKEDGVGGVRVMVREAMCEEVVRVIRVSDRVMTVVVFEEDVLRLIVGMLSKVGDNSVFMTS